MKKNIVIITNGSLPVPAIQGGAAEMLTQTFLDHNEFHSDYNISIFTIGQKSINSSLISKYTMVNFVIINEKSFLYILGRTIKFVINKLFKNNYTNQFLSSVLKNESILNKADLILVSNNQFYAKHIKKKFSAPIILHLHNDYVNNDFNNQDVLFHHDKVIGVSKYIQNRVSEIAPKSCKVSYVYNGINIKKFRDNDNLKKQKEILETYKIEKKDIVFVFTGRLQESKGIRFLVESFLELIKQHENIKLLIIGGAQYSISKQSKLIKNLKKNILNNNAEKKIFFTGYINYEEIQNFYKISHVAVLPSIETEAFGLTSIEAQASGLPVIITDSGGMEETISNKSGFVISRSGDINSQLIFYMKKLISDHSLRNKISGQALVNASKFSDENFYNNLKFELNSL